MVDTRAELLGQRRRAQANLRLGKEFGAGFGGIGKVGFDGVDSEKQVVAGQFVWLWGHAILVLEQLT